MTQAHGELKLLKPNRKLINTPLRKSKQIGKKRKNYRSKA